MAEKEGIHPLLISRFERDETLVVILGLIHQIEDFFHVCTDFKKSFIQCMPGFNKV